MHGDISPGDGHALRAVRTRFDLRDVSPQHKRMREGDTAGHLSADRKLSFFYEEEARLDVRAAGCERPLDSGHAPPCVTWRLSAEVENTVALPWKPGLF